MARLRLAFLGTPEVSHVGQAVAFRTRKALALLVYLAVEDGIHPREKLAALLWPESDAERARTSLRRALASLRDALEEPDSFADQHILVEREALGFNFAADFDLDTRVLHTAWMQARAGGDLEHPEERLARLLPALILYRGDFLEGFSVADAPAFDTWVSSRREALHRQVSLIFERVSELQFDDGDLAGAAGTADSWVTHDNLNESAHRCLMQALFASGDRAAALEAYERCRAVLEIELGLQPSPETEALAERLRTKAPPRTRRVDRPTGVGEPPPPILKGPLVGRADEHRRLVTQYFATIHGKAQVGIIEGEEGIGKTRLATEFLNWASAQGADVLYGGAFEAGGNLPYQPIIDAFRRRLSREETPADLLGDVWLGELSRLLPELRERYPDLPPASREESTAQTRLFESATRLGQALSERAPLILFVDDVQWADGASLDLMHYALRRWVEGNAPVLVLLTMRTEALTRNPSLTDWLSGLGRVVATRRMKLGALTAEDTKTLIDVLAGVETAAEDGGSSQGAVATFSQWLYSETGGQPFYLIEALRTLLDDGKLAQHLTADGRWVLDVDAAVRRAPGLEGFVPRGVREIILARLAHLTSPSAELLTAGAVLGGRFSFEMVKMVAELDESVGLRALEDCLSSHLLREEKVKGKGSPVVRPYHFSHDKIRDVVYAQAGAARRLAYHRRAYDALLTISAPAAELAHHALVAGLPEPAFQHSVAAGDEAMDLFAVQDAVAHYSQALELLHSGLIGSPSSDLIIHLYSRRGRALELRGKFTEAQANYEEMESFALRLDNPSMRLAALIGRAALHTSLTAVSDLELGQQLSEEALSLSHELGDRWAEAKILWNLLLLNVYTAKRTKAVEYGEQSLTIARQLGLREQLAYTLTDIQRAYFSIGQMARGRRALDEARELWRELRNQAMLADTLGSSAEFLMLEGEFEQALAAADEAYQISQSIDNQWGQIFSRTMSSFAHFMQGNLGEALVGCEEVIRLAEPLRLAYILAPLQADMAWVNAVLGDWATANDLRRRAETILGEEEIAPTFRSWALAALARVDILSGDLTGAEKHLNESQVGANLEGLTTPRDALMPLGTVELALAQEDYRRALTAADELADRLRTLGALAYLPDALLLKGQALLSLGRMGKANKALQEARQIAQSLGCHFILWPILVTLSELEARRGDTAVASQLRGQAREIVQYLAEHMDRPDLKGTFLDLPQNQALVDR